MKKWWIAGGILTVWTGVQPSTLHGQSTNWRTWEHWGVVWCGDSGVWNVDSTSHEWPIHRMNASEAGTQILWGCPTFAPQEGALSWSAWTYWEQDLHGSNANRSGVFWAAPPDTSAIASAEILAMSHEAGWLDETGGFAAGTNGSDDPLSTHAPLMGEWEVVAGCHAWSEPFAFNGIWDWYDDGHWKVNSWDASGRSQTWVDTLTLFTTNRLPCMGIEVKHTSSNGDRWAFGWVPTNSMDALNTADLFPATVELMAPDVLEGVLHFDTAEAGLALNAALLCDDGGDGLQTLLPESTLCDNVWQWQLPCSLSAGQSVVIECNDLVDTLWRDGSGLLTRGDLAFTEIMADPTPALHAPESTYLEVLNVSSLAFDPTKLHLVDSDDTLHLEWVRPTDHGVVVPGDHFIVADAAGPWANWTTAAVVRAVGWSGLRDAGESLTLLGPDLNVVEDLTFLDHWWREVSQDGQSLSCASPLSCDDPANWQPDPLGASPGRSTTLAVQPVSNRPGVSLRRTPDDKLTLQPHAPWDPRKEVSLHFNSPMAMTSTPLAHAWNEEGFGTWECPIPEGAIGPFRLTIPSPPACQSDLVLTDIDTLWGGHRAPRSGDVLLTEILPSAHPILETEFVEWVNASNDTLGWKGSPWLPGACLVQATHTLAHVQTWTGSSWFENNEDVIWECLPDLAFTNDNGEASLTDEWGNVLVTVAYSQCGHSSSKGASEGRSMECLPVHFDPALSEPSTGLPAWRTSPSDVGMSPGRTVQWEISEENASGLHPASWGVLEDSWVMTVPVHASAHWWDKHLWEPVTTWTPFWHRGRLMVRANHGPSMNAMGPVNLQHPELSFPEVSWHFDASPRATPRWNEVLKEPRSGHATFLEWWIPEVSLWSGQWHWSSQPNPDPHDFVAVSEVDWLLAPHSWPCFASCPNWVETRGQPCLSANVPSLHGDRVLTSQSQERMTSVEISSLESSAWVLEEEGRSMARIPETDLWTSTPPPSWATPGEPNGPANITAPNDGVNRRLKCPQSIQPGGDHSWDVAKMTWSPPSTNDLYHLSYGVLDPMRTLPLQTFEATWSSVPLQWAWRGTDEDNLLVSPGPYLAVVQWVEHSTGHRGVDRCMVAVAPRQ
ncbi:MAG: hypothetical protein ACPF87_02105 [Flavobacteriales bacterium]